MSVYLGLDCGTQSLNAVAVEVEGGEGVVLLQRSLPYDEAFPGYGTRNGVFEGTDPLVVTSSPLLWADALDTLLGEVAPALGNDLARVAAIAGSGQQHGSVYLRVGFEERLAALEPRRDLVGQLEGAFSVERSPVWMDASTGPQCAAIAAAVGGDEALARITGSRATERFTGAQIRKLAETDPAAWAATDRIHLVSSYLASLLLGAHAPLDTGDASGMNLLDLRSGAWSPAALAATADSLEERLPRVVPPVAVVGPLAEYWSHRHGFPRARVVAWTGDNPSSLVGLGVLERGTTAISLGTSDTVFSLMAEPRTDPLGTGHVFGAPTGGFMSLVCFRNGSLARERVRDRFGMDWTGFSRALRETSPGNGGALMLPWFEPEITPPVHGGGERARGVDPGDAATSVRACVEGQMMAMRRHSAWAAPSMDRIRATGGAARNREILQVMADVFQAPVEVVQVPNAACLGAALRAAHADRVVDGGPGDVEAWRELSSGFLGDAVAHTVAPRSDLDGVYRASMAAQADFEARCLGDEASTPPPAAP